MVSGDFESWGDPGPGRWITIYANAGHVWMEVAGWRFDTVALAESGTRWARGGGEFSGFVVRHPAGPVAATDCGDRSSARRVPGAGRLAPAGGRGGSGSSEPRRRPGCLIGE